MCKEPETIFLARVLLLINSLSLQLLFRVDQSKNATSDTSLISKKKKKKHVFLNNPLLLTFLISSEEGCGKLCRSVNGLLTRLIW